MNVKIIALTQPVQWLQEQGIKTAEDLLVYEARVSNPANQLNNDTADKLIAFMIRNKHWSPFDMVNMTMEVTTSKAISIQILRHWSIKPQEFSQRYAEVTDVEPIEVRLKADSNRQSSTQVIGEINNEANEFGHLEFNVDSTTDIEELIDWLEDVSQNLQRTMGLYKSGIKMGIAKESARMILPMASSTTMYLNGSVRSWIHYMEQRCDLHAQAEHQQVAKVIMQHFKENFPYVSKALNLI